MNENVIDELQDLALQQLGLSLVVEIVRAYKGDNPDLFDEKKIDAIEYFLSKQTQRYASDIKTCTECLK